MTTTHTVKIEDHEGDGRCSACGREGLRWIVRLSDGTGVGLECAKRVLGYRPAPESYKWVADFDAVAEHSDGGVTYVLWQRRGGFQTRMTENGALMIVGGARKAWERDGWAL